MKVKGDISFLQSNIDFYLKLVLTDAKSVSELRDRYFSMFLEEERRRMRLKLEEQNKLIESEEEVNNDSPEDVLEESKGTEQDEVQAVSPKDFLNSVMSNVSEQKEASTESGDSLEEVVSITPKDFLSSVLANRQQVEPVIAEQDESIVEETVSVTPKDFLSSVLANTKQAEQPVIVEQKEVHGVFLDETPVEIGEIISHEYSDHGIYIDDLQEEYKVEVNEVFPEYSEHGVFIDDLEESQEVKEGLEKPFEEYDRVESSNDNEEILGVFLDDEETLEDVPISSEVEEFDIETYETEENNTDISEQKDQESNYFEDYEGMSSCSKEDSGLEEVAAKPVKEEVVNVPSSIRQFLKEHPNSTIEFVSKYYSQKEIQKQLKLGKIYKKRGKLFI